MKKKLIIVSLLVILTLCLSSCSKEVVLPDDFNVNTSNEQLSILAVIMATSASDQELLLMANEPEALGYTEEVLGYEPAVFEAISSGAITAKEEAGSPKYHIDFTSISSDEEYQEAFYGLLSLYSQNVEYEVSGINKEIVTVTIPVEYEKYIVNYEFTFTPNPAYEYNPSEPAYIMTQGVVSTQYPIVELLKKAAMNTGMGMGIVFIVLIFISFIISLFKYLPGSGAKQQKAKEEAKKAAALKATTEKAVATNAPSASDVLPQSENLMDDKELVAVITAAIYAANAAGPAIVSSDRLVVRSIKRVSR